MKQLTGFRGTLHRFNSIGTRINVIFALMVLLFAILLFNNSRTMTHISASYKSLSDDSVNVVKLKEQVVNCNTSINEYLRSGNRTNLADYNDNTTAFRITLTTIGSRQTDLDALSLVRSLSDAFETYSSTCSTACFKFYHDEPDYIRLMYEAQRINGYMQQYCDTLLQNLLETGETARLAMQARQQNLERLNLLALGGVLILFAMSMVYVNVNINKPLSDLVTAAGKIADADFDVQVATNRMPATIGVLGDAFNTMTRSIKQMMTGMREKAETERNLLTEKQKNAEAQQLLSQANFLALQTQTNPHFLFNTLNSISRTITLGMDDKAIMMIDDMVALLRYNLTNAEIPVSLGQEMAITKAYLNIQQYRFQDRMTFEVDMDPAAVTGVMLPRFTLQPLVENAILHGLEPKESGGRIRIRVRIHLHACTIRIVDNGVGIAPERLAVLIPPQARNGSLQERQGTSIGLANTAARLAIFTKQPDALRIQSKVGIGTVVTATVPVKEE